MKIVDASQPFLTPVYDIGVDETHNFILNNGLVSHNCFNKSHSIAYSYISYMCAWLKANYPQEFFCALMTTRSRSLQPKDWATKAPEYINEARLLNISIHAPTVNASSVGFTIKDGEIFFGLNAIKGVGIGTARSIVACRGKKPFSDIYDFITRVNTTKVDTGTFQSLIKAGAFDRMGYLRADLLRFTTDLYGWVKDTQELHERERLNATREYENIEIGIKIEKRNELRRIKRLKRERDLTEEEEEYLEETNGLRLHRLLTIKQPVKPDIPRHRHISLSVNELMDQAEHIGCYIGTHPATIVYPSSTRMANAELGEKQSLAGTVNYLKEITDRNGNKMAFIGFGDGTGRAEGVIFASTYAKLAADKRIPKTGDLIETFGMVDQNDPEIKVRIYSLRIHRSDT